MCNPFKIRRYEEDKDFRTPVIQLLERAVYDRNGRKQPKRQGIVGVCRATDHTGGNERQATTNAIKAKEDADEATKKANAATDAANKAKEDCDTATEDAQEATTAANEATAAAQEATEAAQEATEEAVNATDNVLLTLGRLVPTGMTVESVTRLTVGNVKPNYIKAALSPASAMKNVIFISDNKAITVGTDGRITIVGTGKSTVHVIPTCNTALAKTLLIEVVAPALRKVNSSSLRLTQSGALRFG